MLTMPDVAHARTPSVFFLLHLPQYLGEYPAPGAGSRWSSATKLGANCEEEYVDGEVSWVCYIH